LPIPGQGLNHICEAVVALPLVLPPSVLGFYLLLLFSRKGFLGNLWDKIFGHQLAFHFDGLLIASLIFSLPFMVQPLIAGNLKRRKRSYRSKLHAWEIKTVHVVKLFFQI